MEVFHDYAYYYNTFYRDKDYNAEAQIIDKLIKQYAGNVKNIINFGCGTGRHDVELSRLGYCCKGIDLSSDMIDIARQNAMSDGNRIDFEVADVRNYVSEQIYEVVISLFHVMSYQNDNEDILSAFQSARKALNKNGIFIFDTWYGPGVLSDKPSVRVKSVEDKDYRLVRIATPILHDKTNVVDVNYEAFIVNKKTNLVKTIQETHHMRYFFRPELEMLLEQAGFQLLDNVDCQTLGETDYDSWTSYFIAKAVC